MECRLMQRTETEHKVRARRGSRQSGVLHDGIQLLSTTRSTCSGDVLLLLTVKLTAPEQTRGESYADQIRQRRAQKVQGGQAKAGEHDA
eukprot:5177004-Prymnesium_polylepis.1